MIKVECFGVGLVSTINTACGELYRIDSRLGLCDTLGQLREICSPSFGVFLTVRFVVRLAFFRIAISFP